MKIRKLAQGLAVIPLIGAASILGTQPAIAAGCSGILSCAVAPAPTVQPPTTQEVQAALQPFQSVIAPTQPVADAVKAPVGKIVTPATAPAADAINKATAPIAPSPYIPPVPVIPVAQSPAPAEAQTPPAAIGKATMAETGANTTAQANAEPVVAAAAQIHNSGSANSGGLHESVQTPRALDATPVALHSSQGEMTKYWNAGMFGFGHLDPADAPRSIGLAITYFITLGTTIGFAIKKGAFLLARKTT